MEYNFRNLHIRRVISNICVIYAFQFIYLWKTVFSINYLANTLLYRYLPSITSAITKHEKTFQITGYCKR